MAETRSEFLPEIPGYELLEEIGRGGVSTVYLARHRLLERQVAIKVMSPALTLEEGFTRRFIREGQTIAQLGHPGIVTVYDVSVADHRPFIAMEYLPGGSLKDRMSEPIPAEDALVLLRSIADSLGYAHECGVFHRDVKPENILFRDSGHPVLTDFGIAKSDSQDTALTSVGVVVGTPRYISPEQAQGHGCDARSDIYALGVILYEMLTGQPPYDVKGSMSLLYAHINEPIPRLPEHLAEYQELVDDLLAKDPSTRIARCSFLVEWLDEYLGTRGGTIRSARPERRSKRGSGLTVVGRRIMAAGLILLPVVAAVAWLYGTDGLPGNSWRTGDDLTTMVSRLLNGDPASDSTARPEPHGESAPESTARSMPRGEPIRASAQRNGEEAQEKAEPERLDARLVFARARALAIGRGVERDPETAARLYRKAADQGHSKAQYYLGVAYGNGDGVARDDREALKWLRRASHAGEPGAQYNLILARIFGPQRDAARAAELARKLAQRKYAPVYRILGWMYNTGTGVDSSFTQSVKWNAKTMVGDVTGKSGPPAQVVHHWERRMQAELNKIWGSEQPGVAK